ncbi:MAG TPA: GT4 family glycosyltransferase PelF [Fluviicoccus sp.]|nr:GT4 family glycosyltransferase PelF [Fluviicoccus sp.]
MTIIRQGTRADIGLLLEGTFPYVSGGVSSWVNQIIRGFPEYTFALCFIGSRPQDYGDMRYALPDNVVHLETHYLHDGREKPPVVERQGDAAVFREVRALHEQYRATPPGGGCPSMIGRILSHRARGAYREEDFLYSRESWNFITEQYRAHCTDPSFVDYFWTVRIMHAPLWRLMDIADGFIPVRAFHTISTGYAGFLGALLKVMTGKPLLLSEHGIYTKERKIDLFQAEWIRDNRGVLEKDSSEVAYFRHLWVRFFEALGRECYTNADRIISLYEANRQRQIRDGAPADRTENIPNGINLPALQRARARRPDGVPRTVCLIGRVVPIKDVKTFIRAMRTVANRLPDVQAWIAGPEDEDPAYARDCRTLAAGLGLADTVQFLGFQRVDELLPKVGVLALSSISEALPLVILEGYAAGVPCVATDVGSCRQLVEGLDGPDRQLGPAGRVVGIADPQALAEAVIALLDDEAAWREAQAAGIARVERYYTQDLMFAAYREVYGTALAESPPLSPVPEKR